MKKTVLVCDAPGESSCERLAVSQCAICDADACSAHLPDTIQLLFTIQAPVDAAQSIKQIREPRTYGVGARVCLPCSKFFRDLAMMLWQKEDSNSGSTTPFIPRLSPVFDQLCGAMKAINAAKRLGSDNIALRKIADGDETASK